MELVRESTYRYVIPPHEEMRVPAVVYTTEDLLPLLTKDEALRQLANVARLPGVVRCAVGMPDMHQGYAFPIGTVAAFDIEEGVVSPGGVGFDINCGVRVIRTSLTAPEVKRVLEEIGNILFATVPAGLGSRGLEKFSHKEARRAMKKGLGWALEKGMAVEEDLEATEEEGCLRDADPQLVSDEALDRGREEFGTLGSGNHFLEIDVVEKVFDPQKAKALGLFEGQVVIWIHTGSRGLGHQIAMDYMEKMRPRMESYGIPLFERDFVSLPVKAPQSQAYLGAMAAAANFAWVNRQLITHRVREAFSRVFRRPWDELGLFLLYDVAHNIAKYEVYEVDGAERMFLVHRKGATRAFPAGHPALRGIFREVGQPILLPGDMKRGSYVLLGTDRALKESFGSVAHGAGRQMSRHAAKKAFGFKEMQEDLAREEIRLYAVDRRRAQEEAPGAYKDVDAVVKPLVGEGLAVPVVRTRPLLVIKG
ncbi:protein of unknown function UPF0027 [Spirochaeta thermophila DSM 6578]|uniref:tRNA-splicing ligase RtcB n=1 Tax=Winmispira thermophila (strain ATCC 700085 / DSM 6578 / Z-1203) TaxID=869211 RepID=G0GBB6_WINT7|nr:RtcB family protein [Spirochaeta thermophila]AEJ61925.1 protein of unknown function UPF0027 [Spirochaeta thermophila DSM 6578]